MLPLNADDRVRILAATVKKSPGAHALRVVVITASLALLSAPPLFGWVRLDVWGGNHLLLGERVSIFDAIKGFVVALAILYGGTFLSNMIVGRFFCGWGCPVGYVSRLGEETESTRGARRKLGRHLLGAGFVVAFTGATLLWWVDPRVLLDGSVVAKAVVLGVWIVLSLGGFLHAFKWRFTFCLRACPIGLYYRLVTSKAPVGIVFDESPSPCIECGACVDVCPVLLDPKKLGEPMTTPESADADPDAARYGDAECLRCGDCVFACKLVYLKRPGETAPLRYGSTRAGALKRRPSGAAGSRTINWPENAGDPTGNE